MTSDVIEPTSDAGIEAVDDINDVFEDIFLTEERIIDESFHHGLEDGRQEQSVQEAEDYGFRKGTEIGREIGFYHTIVTTFASQPEAKTNEKVQTLLQETTAALDQFPRDNDVAVDLLHDLQRIRNRFRRLCALLKVPFKYTQTNDLSF